MGRRYRNIGAGAPIERGVFGDFYVQQANSAITTLSKRTAALQVKFNHTREAVLTWLFEDQLIADVKKIRGVVTPSRSTMTYRFFNGPESKVALWINYDESLVPTINPEYLRPYPDRIGPMLQTIEELQAIYQRFEVVRHCMRWMNKNATPGAVRYYFPAILPLVKGSPAIMDDLPTRFATPNGISEQLPLLKEASTTLAMAQLLPSDAEVNPVSLLRVDFESDMFSPCVNSLTRVHTDAMQFFL